MKHSGDVSFIFLLPKAKSQIGHTVCVKKYLFLPYKTQQLSLLADR